MLKNMYSLNSNQPLTSIATQWKMVNGGVNDSPIVDDEPVAKSIEPKTKLMTLGIAQWFAYRYVFITGGTGFIGKVLIEKLLRSCPNIERIYLLIRYKHTKSPEERLMELINDRIFDNLRKSNPYFFEKLQAINGDLSLPNLKISQDDLEQKLNQNVSVVFHCGAITNENESIKLTIATNTSGTKHLLRIASQFVQLEAFVFLSPLHAQPTKEVIGENIMMPGSPASKVTESILSFRNGQAEKLTKQILGPSKKNSYHFSKILAEQIIATEDNYLPVCIVRAGQVTAAAKEPVSGWIDKQTDLTNLIIAIGNGSLRFYNSNPNYTIDIVPVDVVANCMISASWFIANNRSSSETIFNCTTGRLNPLTWEKFNRLIPKYTREYPFENVVWYPVPKVDCPSRLRSIYNYFAYKIPAFVLDMGRIFIARKPQFFKSPDQHISDEILNDFQFYTTNQWLSDNTNLLKLQSAVSREDQDIFNMNIKSLVWEQYLENYVKGIRRFILKQDDTTIASSKTLLRRYYFFAACFQFLWIALSCFVYNNPFIINLIKEYFNNLKDWYASYNISVPVTDLSLLGVRVENVK